MTTALLASGLVSINSVTPSHALSFPRLDTCRDIVSLLLLFSEFTEEVVCVFVSVAAPSAIVVEAVVVVSKGPAAVVVVVVDVVVLPSMVEEEG